MPNYDSQRDKILKKIHETDGELNFLLEKFGDYIAKRENYSGLTGIGAIYLYLIHKFKWLPRDVRSMSYDDIRFVLIQELNEWTVKESNL